MRRTPRTASARLASDRLASVRLTHVRRAPHCHTMRRRLRYVFSPPRLEAYASNVFFKPWLVVEKLNVHEILQKRRPFQSVTEFVCLLQEQWGISLPSFFGMFIYIVIMEPIVE